MVEAVARSFYDDPIFSWIIPDEAQRLSRLRRGFDLFCLVFLPALLVISFGRMFTFEVERIWLFLVPFIVIAAAKNIVRDDGRVKWSLLGTAMVLLFAQAWMTEWLFYTYW